MCGIIAGIGHKNYRLKSKLIMGLKRLEYRGNDSTGICFLNDLNHFVTVKTLGKLPELKKKLEQEAKKIDSYIGIAHTRWATHGKADSINAHPHQYGDYCIVHNGVIENFNEIKSKMSGIKLRSITDSEVIVAYLSQLKGDMPKKLLKLRTKLRGSYSSVYLDRNDPDHLYALKESSPLIIGLSKEANFIASDVNAFADFVDDFIYLEDGDIAKISESSVKIFDEKLKEVKRKKYPNQINIKGLTKGKYKHFMEKEIYEQPSVLEQTIFNKLTKNSVIDLLFGVQTEKIIKETNNIQLIGCGTSLNACLLAKYWLEDLTQIPTQVESASEYLYRNAVITEKTLVIALSQSGETADIISAVKKIKSINASIQVLAICNTQNSELVRISDLAFITQAGIEISVASTKSFTTQLASLMLLCLVIMKVKKINESKIPNLVADLKKIPNQIKKILDQTKLIKKLAFKLIDKKNALFIAKGMQFPIAIEGALKLKEISYIHAEAYAAGELKHGPLALIDGNMPVIAIIDENNLYEKIKSSLEIVSSRGGQLFIFTNEKITDLIKKNNNTIYIENNLSHYLSPITFNVCLQLLAYYVALEKGTDIDQPRNLAKSVTVE